MLSPRKADQAAAAARLRSDKAAAKALQRKRLVRERPERVSMRAESDRSRQVKACAKLAVRAKRAHEDHDNASLRDQRRKQVLIRRADEDYAALCPKS